MHLQYGRMFVWPPKSQTWKFKFLIVICSTLKPIVGIFDIICSGECSLYRIVVLPLLSSPRINIRASLAPNMLAIFENKIPMCAFVFYRIISFSFRFVVFRKKRFVKVKNKNGGEN